MLQGKKFAEMSMAAKGGIVAGALFVVVVIIGTIIAMNVNRGHEPSLPQEVVGASMAPVAQDVRPGFGVAGTGEVPVPGYHEMVTEAERARAAEVAAQGGSVISDVLVPATMEPPPQKAPETPPVNQQVIQTPSTAVAPQYQQISEAEMMLMQSATRQIHESLARWGTTQPVLMGASWPAPAPTPPDTNAGRGNGSLNQSPVNPPNGSQGNVSTALARAGSIYPITFDTSGSTESPGAIRATIHGGALNGAILIGQINRVGEYGATVKFSRLVTRTETIAVNAIAMNSSATGANVADRVDKKFLERYILRPLGVAASAIAEAIPQKQESTVVNTATGSSVASSGISSEDIAGIAVSRAIETVSTDMSRRSDQPVAYIDPSWMSNSIASVMFMDDVFSTK